MSTEILLHRDRTMSGVLRFDGLAITYFYQPSSSISLLASEVALIGEYTVESDLDDLFSEDHFLVFVLRNSGEWLEVPVDAAGCEEILEQLSQEWSTVMTVSLVKGAGFTSQIIWPPEQQGEPLFVFNAVRGIKLRDRLKLLLLPQVVLNLSPKALRTAGIE